MAIGHLLQTSLTGRAYMCGFRPHPTNMESRVRVAERLQMELAAVEKQVELKLGVMDQCGDEIFAKLEHASDTQGQELAATREPTDSSFTSLLIPAEHARKRSADTFERKIRESEDMKRARVQAAGPAMVTWVADAIGSLVETGTLDAVKDKPFPKTGSGYFLNAVIIRAADKHPQGITIELQDYDLKFFVDLAQPVLENHGYSCIHRKHTSFGCIDIRFEPAELPPPSGKAVGLNPRPRTCVCQ